MYFAIDQQMTKGISYVNRRRKVQYYASDHMDKNINRQATGIPTVKTSSRWKLHLHRHSLLERKLKQNDKKNSACTISTATLS